MAVAVTPSASSATSSTWWPKSTRTLPKRDSPSIKGFVDFRLDEAVLAVPAELLGLRVVDEDDLSGTVDQAHDVLRVGVRPDRVHQTDGLDGAEGFVVQTDAAWVVDQIIPGLEHGHAAAVHAQDVCQHQAGRAGPDDEDFRALGERIIPTLVFHVRCLRLVGRGLD